MKKRLRFYIETLAIGTVTIVGIVGSLNTKASAQKAIPANYAVPRFIAQAYQHGVRFACGEGYDPQTVKRLPTTFVWTRRGKIALIRWKTSSFAGASFTPVERCRKVSAKFDEAYHNGSFKYLTNGKKNGQPVICTAREYKSNCDTVLMTLRPEDDALRILQQFSDIFNGKQAGPIPHSSKLQVYHEVDIENVLSTDPVELK
jgi:hypothetical protein